MASSPPDPPSAQELPPELRRQLTRFQRQLWRTKVLEAALAGFCGLVVSFLLVFAVDRFVSTPPGVRLAILLGGTSLAAIFAPLWIRRWVFGHRREEELARLISQKFPRLGDRLLGVVELQDQSESQKALSPELRQAAMEHVARQAAKREFSEALPGSRNARLAVLATLTVALVVAGFVFSPKAGLNALHRWLMPYSEVERYTFTQLDLSAIPDPLVVPYGEEFPLNFGLSALSDQTPESARARYTGQNWLSSALSKDHQFGFTFPGQQKAGYITIESGDAVKRLRVTPETRPELTSLQAEIKLPSYLQLPNRITEIRMGALPALVGSSVILSGKTTRGLAEVTAVFEPEIDAATATRPILPGDPPPRLEIPFQATAEGFESSPVVVKKQPGEFLVNFTDELGLQNRKPFRLRLAPTEDQAPSAYIQGISRQIVLLASETIEFEVLADDDFGLRDMGLIWGELPFVPQPDQPLEDVKSRLVLKKGSPTSNRLRETAIFSPKDYGLKPGRFVLQAYTRDFRPGAAPALSAPLVVYILTPDEHAQRLKAKFDRIIGELEDLARKEQNNLDANERLDRRSGEKLQTEENLRKLAESETREDENARKMQELADRMTDLFQDANRNEDIAPETMSQLAEALQDMKELAETDIPEARDKLGEAQEKRNTPKKTKRNLNEAVEKQKEIVKKLQDTIAKANEANENFEASTFVNRLKRAARDIDQVAKQLIAAMSNATIEEGTAESSILGSLSDRSELDPVHHRLLTKLKTKQATINSDVSWIQEDLGHFYARTQKKEHLDLLNKMRESKINLGLERLLNQIRANHTFRAAHSATEWTAEIRKLIKSLEGSKGGGGGGGGSQQRAQSDFEFMLKVMRLVQQEQDLRSRTRALEQLRRSKALENGEPLPEPPSIPGQPAEPAEPKAANPPAPELTPTSTQS